MSRTKKPVVRPQEPSTDRARAIAAKAVGAWFADLLDSPDPFVNGFDSDYSQTFDEVREALIGNDTSEAADALADQQAGYIIGVQVGLRLAGGAR